MNTDHKPAQQTKCSIAPLTPLRMAVAFLCLFVPLAPGFAQKAQSDSPLFDDPVTRPGQDVRYGSPQIFIRDDAPSNTVGGLSRASIFEEEPAPEQSAQQPPRAEIFQPEPAPTTQGTPVSSQPAPVAEPVPAPPVSEPKEPTVPELLESGRLREVGIIAENNRDAKLASAIAWKYYEQGDYYQSERWFKRAMELGSDSMEARYALALIAFNEGDFDRSASLIRGQIRRHEESARLYADLLGLLASSAYSAGQYDIAANLLLEAARMRYLSRDEQLLLAWSLTENQKYADAKPIFEGLYRAYRDRQSADGLLNTMGKLNLEDELVELARELGGPLSESVVTEEIIPPAGNLAYEQGRYQAAAAKSTDVFTELENIGRPTIFLAGGFRGKSGDDGLGSLSVITMPSFGIRFNVFDKHSMDIAARYISLDAGTADPNKLIGLVTNPPAPFFTHEPTKEVTGHELNFNYRYQGDISPYLNILMPVEGEISSRPAFTIGTSVFHKKGKIEAEIFSQPIQESLLSYTGIRDPNSGFSWGRVTKTGGAVRVSQEIVDNYLLSAELSAARYDGKNVPSNDQFGASLELKTDLGLNDFTYFAVGPGLRFQHFDKNLGQFTYGHGGYFSPEYLVQADFGVNFLTQEFQSWIAKVDALLGYQANRQDTSPYFPLNPDGRYHPSAEQSSFVFGLRTQGAFMLTPKWHLGGYFDFNKTADYDAYGLGLYIGYNFGNRQGLTREDIALPWF